MCIRDRDQVAQSVQKEDIREAIDNGWIKAKAIQGTSRVRALKRQSQKQKGRRKGHGKRSGTSNARNPRKQQWMATIRAQRRTLKDLREDGSITRSQYRHYYLKAKGGSYRSISHLKTQMGLEGISIGGDE